MTLIMSADDECLAYIIHLSIFAAPSFGIIFCSRLMNMDEASVASHPESFRDTFCSVLS